MKAEAIVGGVMVVGGLGFVAYMMFKPSPKPLGSDFDTFTSYKVTDTTVIPNLAPQACKQKCIDDPKCKAASYNLDEKNCITTTKDPYVNAVPTNAGQWQIYIRRPIGADPSSWSAWDPQVCPQCGEKTDVVMRRTCTGPKCLGPSEHQCDVGACYDVFEGFRAE